MAWKATGQPAIRKQRSPNDCSGPGPVNRRACGAECSAPSRDLIETTELRWFEAGALPATLPSWFTRDSAHVRLEERTDLYRIDDRIDVGVKLRGRSTLEIKSRRSSNALERSPIERDGVADDGVLEVWWKWRPEDACMDHRSGMWVQVSKTILKRRFSIDGDELTVSEPNDPPDRAFCDVEIVAIDVGVSASWSFAMAAQGPPSGRGASIAMAWRTLASVPPPAAWPSTFTISCGYPEWLERRIDRNDSMIHR